MKFPVKFNSKLINPIFKKLLPSTLDPRDLLDINLDPKEFSKLMRVFKFGSTFKTTSFNRYPETQKFLSKYQFPQKPTVLDIGSSDGLASIGLIKDLDFKYYYLTDLNPYVYYKRSGNNIFFYDEKGDFILFSSGLFVIYPMELNSIFFKVFFKSKSKVDDKMLSDLTLIKLINPLILSLKPNVEFHKYNMFELWPKENVDLIVLANILNRVYFSDLEIIKAVNNLIGHCNEGSLLAIIDNRPNVGEKSSIFKLSRGKITLEHKINQGSEIEKLVLKEYNSLLSE